MKIYKTTWHLIATLIFIVAPFLFLLLFASLEKITAETLFADLFVSIGRLALAYIIAAILGWVLAVLFYRGKRAAVVLPVFDVLQSFPTFAAVPLATLYWGQTNFTVIFFLAVTIIWPICFSVVSSLKLARKDWEEVTEIYQLSGWDYLKQYLWPITIPGLITGSIISLGEGWEALVATEIIVGTKSGLGNFFQGFSNNSTVIVLGILGVLLIVFSLNKLLWSPLLEVSHRMMEE